MIYILPSKPFSKDYALLNVHSFFRPSSRIVEKQKCMKPECLISDLEIPDPNCPVTPYSDWSPCSTTCGKGVQIRTRLLLVEPQKVLECTSKKEMNQQRECTVRQDCSFDFETARQICNLEPDVGACRGAYRRFYYNPSKQACEAFEYGGCRGNQNNFLTNENCMSTCGITRNQPSNRRLQPSNLPVDCELSDFNSEWSACSVSCGERNFA